MASILFLRPIKLGQSPHRIPGLASQSMDSKTQRTHQSRSMHWVSPPKLTIVQENFIGLSYVHHLQNEYLASRFGWKRKHLNNLSTVFDVQIIGLKWKTSSKVRKIEVHSDYITLKTTNDEN